jgi:hypothetical protein
MPRRLRQIEFDWTRIADIFSLHYDLEVGDHQRHRGGPSIVKAIELFAAQARSRGTGKANVWKAWTEYKDVAHLVTAATIICCEAHESAKVKPFGEFGLPRSQLRPFNIAMLLPDFVLSLALFWQNYGLEHYSQARDEPMLDPETLWRIPPDMNVSPIKPPVRKIDQRAIAILNARRWQSGAREGIARLLQFQLKKIAKTCSDSSSDLPDSGWEQAGLYRPFHSVSTFSTSFTFLEEGREDEIAVFWVR